ncbi:hypothetical protein [Streptomyces liangshanensis]|uniref:DUF2269 family protein n=1 Tax=Streptomyces liangshanensis TaxID=2717324 RepID=A0A6G9GSH9_9ACTN|nr:hypothetical protein [Streptomyces liangshanensis]QIQ01208.1 hypothetical protein HA039_01820 [Streptomyces liangshanensis]
MTTFLLSVHVLAAIVAIGPVTVAASMFPAAARRAVPAPASVPGTGESAGAGEGMSMGESLGAGEGLATVRVLHRVCRVYAGVGLAVPLFGFATARSMGVLGSPWLITSMVLTAVAAGVLGLLILPSQESVLDTLAGAGPGQPAVERATTARLAMLTGVFNLLWATVTVLMIVRPGSTTGA